MGAGTRLAGYALGALAVYWLITDSGGVALTGSEHTHHAPRGRVPGIPAGYLAEYQAAAGTCPHLDWALLAGVGKVETNHGQSELPGVHSGANFAGAAGPMQFLPSSFASVRARHPDVGPDIYDPDDAIPAAAHYLCDSGVSTGDTYQAVFAYNHADWYVREVLAQAAEYRAAA